MGGYGRRTQGGPGRERRTVPIPGRQPAPRHRSQQRMSSPALNVVPLQFHGEAAVCVGTGDLIREDHGVKTRVLGRHLVTRPQVLLCDFYEAQQRLGLIEVVCLNAFDKWLALNPGDGSDAGTAESVTVTDAVPDLELRPVHVGDGNPPALVALDSLGPAPGEGPNHGHADNARSRRRTEIHCEGLCHASNNAAEKGNKG